MQSELPAPHSWFPLKNPMKKYRLQAEFKFWNGHNPEAAGEDFIDYTGDFECPEDARIRLQSLVIDRMSSRKGWHYKLVSSNVSEINSDITFLTKS